MATVRHYHHHYHFSYETSLRKHVFSIIIVTVLLGSAFLYFLHLVFPSKPLINTEQISVIGLIYASVATLLRLTIAYFISLVLSIPLALFITKNEKYERILLPFFDILQSVPVLAFFPIVVLVFVHIKFFNGAAVFILTLAMLWNLVFSIIGGLKIIPQDINFASFVFGARGVKKLFYVTLPAIFPYMVTGSLLAWAQGWNLLIVAEVLHNYIPGGDSSQDLYGLGTLLVTGTFQGKNLVFLSSLVVMIVLIGLINFFVWQKLLHMAERYKFD